MLKKTQLGVLVLGNFGALVMMTEAPVGIHERNHDNVKLNFKTPDTTLDMKESGR